MDRIKKLAEIYISASGCSPTLTEDMTTGIMDLLDLSSKKQSKNSSIKIDGFPAGAKVYQSTSLYTTLSEAITSTTNNALLNLMQNVSRNERFFTSHSEDEREKQALELLQLKVLENVFRKLFSTISDLTQQLKEFQTRQNTIFDCSDSNTKKDCEEDNCVTSGMVEESYLHQTKASADNAEDSPKSTMENALNSSANYIFTRYASPTRVVNIEIGQNNYFEKTIGKRVTQRLSAYQRSYIARSGSRDNAKSTFKNRGDSKGSINSRFNSSSPLHLPKTKPVNSLAKLASKSGLKILSKKGQTTQMSLLESFNPAQPCPVNTLKNFVTKHIKKKTLSSKITGTRNERNLNRNNSTLEMDSFLLNEKKAQELLSLDEVSPTDNEVKKEVPTSKYPQSKVALHSMWRNNQSMRNTKNSPVY